MLICLAISLNISILQPKLKKRFGETNIKNKEKPGDLNSLLVLSLKHLFEEGFKKLFFNRYKFR